MAGPVNIVVLQVRHRTNEDWLMKLPIKLPHGETLDGSVAVCKLVRQHGNGEIVFEGDQCKVVPEDEEVILFKPSEQFKDLPIGQYSGDLLVKLAGDIDVVTHEITADLKKGVATW